MDVYMRQHGQNTISSLLGLVFLVWGGGMIPLTQAEETALATPINVEQQVALLKTDTNTPLQLEDLEKTLASSSVLTSLPEDHTLTFYDATFTTLTTCDVLLQANPEVLVAVVLSGKIQAKGETAETGEAMAWPLGSETIEVMKYDAGRFLATSPIGLSPATQANLEAVAKQQERLQWWGLLERVNFNLKSPSTPGYLQSVRRRYLGNPTVLSLMREHSQVEALTKAVAETFVEALRKGDAETVEALINPQLFFKGNIQPTSQAWSVFRQNFTFMFLSEPWMTKLADARIEPMEDLSTWLIVGPSQQYHLTLEPFDRMVFVTALEPANEGMAK
ncbi:MAG: hypothetical protein AB7T38_16755 [Nitrospirales bacterium]